MQFGLSNDRLKFRRYLMDGTYTIHFSWFPHKLSDSKKWIWLEHYCRFYTAGRRFTHIGYTTSKSPNLFLFNYTFSSKCLVKAFRMW